MQDIGNFLERLGPVFALLLYVMTFGLGIVLVTISGARLLRRDQPKPHHA